MSLRARRLAAPIVAFLLGLVVLLGAAWFTLAPPGPAATASGVGGPFRLTDAVSGRAVTEADLKGAPHLVFFGFTHCPDICPTKLAEISELFRAMGDRGRGVRALFITVDPERDTPEAMRSYVSSFDPRILALTGSREETDRVVKAYRAYAKRVPLKDGDYTMEHTSLVYLMDKGGGFVGSFNVERTPEDAAADLLRRL